MVQDSDLKPRHVVVAADFEEALARAVRRLPSSEQTKPKGAKVEVAIPTSSVLVNASSGSNSRLSGFVLTSPEDVDEPEQDDEQHLDVVYEVKRTFIHFTLPGSLYSGPSSGPKIASTSDANPRTPINPRRR